MVNTNKKPLHKAKSKIEAEAWIASIGKSNYPGQKLIVHRQGDEWHVYKG
ncbi:hypothetical protein SEA_MOAB_124 [Streptomyces phage Moab]|nr:hypothetical protein SEA_MOAB_124 [Streptomyces phage Moab]